MEKVTDAGASGGAYIWVPDGYARLDFEVPEAGSYQLYSRALIQKEGDAFYFRIDKGPWTKWKGLKAGDAWQWNLMRDDQTKQALRTTLAAGPHSLDVTYHENGAKLDGILLTADGQFNPARAVSFNAKAKDGKHIRLEAEKAALNAPIAVAAHPKASGDRYIEVPNGITRLTFSIPKAATYTLWGRVLAPKGNDDSFWVRVDNGNWIEWNGISPSPAWQWAPVHDQKPAQVVRLPLPAGTHTLTFRQREDGCKLDKLLLTDDLSFKPAEKAPLVLREEISLTGEKTSAGYAIKARSGKFVPDGWQSTDTLSQLKVSLTDGFKPGEAGAIELEVTNFDIISQANGRKNHFFNVYGIGSGNSFGATSGEPFINFRAGKQKYGNEQGQGIKLLWAARGSDSREEKAPFAVRKSWDPRATYTWRAEWTDSELTCYLDGEKIFGPVEFGQRTGELKHVFLATDGIGKIWFAFPGPIYKKLKVYRALP